jgi:hypothetical protein
MRINNDFTFNIKDGSMLIFNNSGDLLFNWSNIRKIDDIDIANEIYKKMALSFFGSMPKRAYASLFNGIDDYRTVMKKSRCSNGCSAEYIAVSGGVLKRCKKCLSTL